MHDNAVKFWKHRLDSENTTFTARENMNRKISSHYEEYIDDKSTNHNNNCIFEKIKAYINMIYD